MILLPQRVLHGAVAYRDFNWFWGPAGLWLPAVVHAAFGWTLAVSRWIGISYAVLTALATYGLVRRWSEPLGVGAAAVMTLIDRASDLPEYAALGLAVLSLYLAYRALIGRRGRMSTYAFLSGLAAGGAFLFRPDRGIGAALALGVVYWGRRQRLQWAALSYGCCLAVFAGYAQLAGWGTTFANVVLTAADVPGARYLPLPLSSYPNDLWLGLLIVGLGVVLAAGWRRRRLSPDSPRGPVLIGGGVLALTLVPEFLQRADLGHLLVASSLAIALLPAALADLSRSADVGPALTRGSLRYLFAVLALFAVAAWQEAVLPYARGVGVSVGVRSPGTSEISNGGRSFIYATPDAPLIAQLIGWVHHHTRPGQTLFVGPGDLSRTVYSDNSIAVLLPSLRDAMHFPDMNPTVAQQHGAQVALDVTAADVLILDRQLDQWIERNSSEVAGSDLANLVVQREFCPTAQFGLYEILIRRPVC